MKVSIITVCYNSGATLRDTINSVASQTYSNKEHIVIDGGSDDASLQIIRSSPSISSYISESDNGIYDAMNKGLSLATGDLIGMLNADDFYFDNVVLEDVAKVFLDPNVEACYGDLIYVKQDDTNQTLRFWKSINYKDKLFKTGWMPAHPTFFARKAVYDRLGMFDLSYKIAADFELLFRLVEQNKIKTKYIPKVLVKMRLGGTTNRSISNIWIQNKEIISILKKYYPDFSLIEFIFRKAVSRFTQFFTRPV